MFIIVDRIMHQQKRTILVEDAQNTPIGNTMSLTNYKSSTRIDE